MDSDRHLFVFTCFVLLCVTELPIAALKKTKHLELQTLKDGELNSQCRVNNDCDGFGFICSQNNTCQCAKQYKPDHDKRICLGGIDQKCQYDEHCIEGAFCMNQSICQCKDHWPFASLDGMECSSGSSIQLPLNRIILSSIILIIFT